MLVSSSNSVSALFIAKLEPGQRSNVKINNVATLITPGVLVKCKTTFSIFQSRNSLFWRKTKYASVHVLHRLYRLPVVLAMWLLRMHLNCTYVLDLLSKLSHRTPWRPTLRVSVRDSERGEN